MTEKVLIIDHDIKSREKALLALETEGFIAEIASDGKAGLEMAREGSYAVILLDVALPGIDGWEVCRQIRTSHIKAVPIIILTARDKEVDRVLGLELGADDYVTKPFSPRELTARVKALIRRSHQYNPEESSLQHGPLTVDPQNNAARIGEYNLELTPKELEMLTLMARHPGKTFTRKELLHKIWQFDIPVSSTRTVDEHIKRIRRKIALYDKEHSYIQTVWGIGYRFELKKNGL